MSQESERSLPIQEEDRDDGETRGIQQL
jgi:hypothetical protein